jgi:hypothetical protein
MNEGLIDECRLAVCPVVFSEGRAPFGDKVDERALGFVDAQRFDRGAVLLSTRMIGHFA